MTEPNACAHCGVPRGNHARRWTSNGHGWHAWAAPSDAQRLIRMKVRRWGLSWVHRDRPEERITLHRDPGLHWAVFTRHGEYDHLGNLAVGTIPTPELNRYYRPEGES